MCARGVERDQITAEDFILLFARNGIVEAHLGDVASESSNVDCSLGLGNPPIFKFDRLVSDVDSLLQLHHCLRFPLGVWEEIDVFAFRLDGLIRKVARHCLEIAEPEDRNRRARDAIKVESRANHQFTLECLTHDRFELRIDLEPGFRLTDHRDERLNLRALGGEYRRLIQLRIRIDVSDFTDPDDRLILLPRALAVVEPV